MANPPLPSLRSVDSPVLVMDQQARIVWLNEAGETLLEFETEELKGSLLWENLIAPDYVDSTRRHYASTPVKQCTLNMVKKSGKRALVEWKNRWVSDPREDTGYVVMTAISSNHPQDAASTHSMHTTCRRKTDFALQESETRFQTLFDSAAEFIFVIDPEGRIMLTNRYVSSQSGYEEDELIGQNIKNFFTEESKDVCDCNFPGLREKGHNRAEIEFITKDGRILQMECSATGILDKNYEFSSFLIIQRDITERKQSAEALADSERRFRAIFNSTFQFIGLLNPEGIVMEANQTALAFSGIANEDVVGEPFWDTPWWSHYSKDERKRLKEAFKQASAGHLVRYETTVSGTGGKTAAIDFSLNPVKNDQGETLLIIPEGRDITERKQAEEDAQRHQLESAHFMRLSLMGEMAAGMAHELNQPLAALISYCGTAHSILSGLPSIPEDIVDMLDRATEQAHRASEIIHHIRNFVSKGNSNKGTVDIDQLISEMSDFLEWELRNSKVNITLNLNAKGRKISANTVQVEQVLLNLIRNSLEAIRNARISDGQLSLETKLNTDQTIWITVTDNGPGIATDMRDRLFEPFQTNKDCGMGMGLSIGRSIIQAHNGKIWLDDACGNGTSFCIELPVIQKAHETT